MYVGPAAGRESEREPNMTTYRLIHVATGTDLGPATPEQIAESEAVTHDSFVVVWCPGSAVHGRVLEPEMLPQGWADWRRVRVVPAATEVAR